MVQERLTLRKIREILRLKHEAGLSNRAIAGACKISNSTVGEYLRRAKVAGIGWSVAETDEDKLYQQLFPEKKPVEEKARVLPDWEAVRKEIHQKGVTLRLVRIEYFEAHPDGYQYTQYCEYYRRWKKTQVEPSQHREHVSGAEMQVDYAGLKIPIVNPLSGEISEASVFVAILPASNYTYAEAQASENQCNWNNGHVRAFEFFGGMVRIIIPDNLKTGVQKPNYYEPDLNPAYQELAEYYQFAVIPARVRRPKDKGKIENGVQNVERWVIAPLRKRTFFSLLETNQAIQTQLEWFNHKPMQAVGRSRREEFEEIDQPNLRALPEKPYEYAERKTARVNLDYHIEFDKHLYSVPYLLIHQKVEIRATERMVEIFSKGELVAVHPRNFRPGRFSTLREHMPANHQFIEKVNAEQLVAWAANLGPHLAALVSATLQARPFPQQAYRSCLGMLSLAKKYPLTLVEPACQAILEAKIFSYTALKDELDWQVKQIGTPNTDPIPTHEYIRGDQYYP